MKGLGTIINVLAVLAGGGIGLLLKGGLKERYQNTMMQALERFGEWLKKKAHAEQNARFVKAFVTTSLVICVGAMAVGSVLIFGVGVNLLFDRGIRVGNLLPALLGPVIYHMIW